MGTPRRAIWIALGVLLVAGGLWMGIRPGIVLLVSGEQLNADSARWNRELRPVEATIVEHVGEHRSGARGGRTFTRTVYQAAPPELGGRVVTLVSEGTVRGRHTVPSKAGQRTTLWYHPDTPEQLRIPGPVLDDRGDRMVYVAGGVFLAFGLCAALGGGALLYRHLAHLRGSAGSARSPRSPRSPS